MKGTYRKYTRASFTFVFIFQMLFWFMQGFGNYIPDVVPVKKPYKITVLGTGYVGLVCGASLAEMGHIVECADVDENKIARLNEGIIPIFEPGLYEIVKKNSDLKRLSFTNQIDSAIQRSDVIFIAVGTPTGSNGSADLSYVEAAAKTIAKNLNSFKTIFIKSTVPIGTGKRISDLIARESGFSSSFELLFNPEFLREGSALYDFFEPDRVVIGTVSEGAKLTVNELYEPLFLKDIPFLYTSIESAEAIKYASNAFLAVKISFINEFANLCDEVGADVFEVASGMGLDKRIGSKFLNPGPGYGGSCFPKDTLALSHMAKSANVPLRVVNAAIEANQWQKQLVVVKARSMLKGSFNGKTIGVLGLAFKPNTDDIRYSPALDVIESIVSEGGHVKAYDPIAMKNMKDVMPHIEYTSNAYQAAENADALIILTEWDEFKKMDLARISGSMKSPLLIDARNMFQPSELRKFGFTFANIGRSKI